MSQTSSSGKRRCSTNKHRTGAAAAVGATGATVGDAGTAPMSTRRGGSAQALSNGSHSPCRNMHHRHKTGVGWLRRSQAKHSRPSLGGTRPRLAGRNTTRVLHAALRLSMGSAAAAPSSSFQHSQDRQLHSKLCHMRSLRTISMGQGLQATPTTATLLQTRRQTRPRAAAATLQAARGSRRRSRSPSPRPSTAQRMKSRIKALLNSWFNYVDLVMISMISIMH